MSLPADIRRAGRKRRIAHPGRTPHLCGVEALADAALSAAAAQRTVVPGEAARRRGGEAATAEMIRKMAMPPMPLGPSAQHGQPLETRARLARFECDLEALLALP